ncbi:hypothetical protein TNIN_346361 [Trichonephila inaurata madagascariensis]|uniref:Uncharacterized protein n=1 Tax=Trichonephila inaurata madagascariensis TaxID=2747483 RepID=A0A8X6YBU6_9ARAC|nr:hypothetical protein TNIN_346361 [Trichonephila inaurata madagascariensis]
MCVNLHPVLTNGDVHLYAEIRRFWCSLDVCNIRDCYLVPQLRSTFRYSLGRFFITGRIWFYCIRSDMQRHYHPTGMLKSVRWAMHPQSICQP